MRPLKTALLLLVLSGCHESTTSDQGASRAAAAPSHAATAAARVGTNPGQVGQGTPLSVQAGHELAAFAAGCFWGVEDAFRHVPGVTATAVGYTGGHTSNPTYSRVCEHDTGHAETVLIEFDPKGVSYSRLLDIFFEIHDPTTLNRQGPDYGDQYRSAIFTLSPVQEQAARAAVLRAQKKQSDKIVTEISDLRPFYRAEDYHQQYAERTGSHGCPIRQFSAEGSASL
ncbi:MAG TPA: peptide-methionine (S)-S-oxide reductase MsrA [Polyangiaceae bacterium]|nr:peptide-methionine (S)-S-oxide reductase MsrA [Polyangiaceae bacterium]